MELHFFQTELLKALPPRERVEFESLAKSLHMREGRPFFLNDDSLPDLDLDGFAEYLMDPSRPSARTWRTYAYQVSIFLRFLKSQEIDWREVQRKHLDLYYNVRTGKDFQNVEAITNRSWNLAKAAIVLFYNFALEQGLVDKLPFKVINRKVGFGGGTVPVSDLAAKSSNKQITFISISDYKSVWRPALARSRNSQRNLALVDLLITSGLRISEALNLQVHQIPDPQSTKYRGLRTIPISIQGKGAKIRTVKIPVRIIRAIRFYIGEERGTFRENAGVKSNNPVFLTGRGTQLSVRTVEDLFQRISSRCSVKLIPHGCRHTFAIYSLDAMIKIMAANLKTLKKDGADSYRQVMNDPLRQLQRLMGHASIMSTYIYLDFLEEFEAIVDESLGVWTDWKDGSDES